MENWQHEDFEAEEEAQDTHFLIESNDPNMKKRPDDDAEAEAEAQSSHFLIERGEPAEEERWRLSHSRQDLPPRSPRPRPRTHIPG